MEIGWPTLWRFFVFLAIVAILYFARSSFAMLFVGVVVSLGIDPLVTFLAERVKMGRVLGTLLTFLFVIAILVLIAYLVVPVVGGEVRDFAANFNQSFSDLFGFNIPIPGWKDLGHGVGQIVVSITSGNASVPAVVANFFSDLLLTVGAIVVTLYLSIEKDGADKMLRWILPASYEKQIIAVFDSFKNKMRKWLGTQLILSLFIGVAVGLGMWFIGVRYPFILGVLAAIFEVVPIIGPIVTGAVAFLIAISSSLTLAIYAVLFFLFVQQLENHVLVPLIMGRSMKVHPVIVVVSLLAGGEIAGFVGILLGVPISVLIQEIFNYLSEQREQRPRPDS